MAESPLALSRHKQFWLCQVGGWSAWIVLLVIRDLTFVPAEYMLGRISIYLVSAIMGIVLTSGLRKLYCRVWDRRGAIRAAAVILGSLAAVIIWQPFRNYMDYLSFGEFLPLQDYGWLDLFRGALPYSFPVLILWSGLYFFIKYYQLFQEEKEKNLRSEALAQEAQLRMLRYQLNPHFLFNTLNAISTLVLQKATVPANEMLIKLSKFLRYSLDNSPLDQVSLAHEIETSNLYLDIEKVRFGERMKLEISIADAAQQALVPSLILQPLIENSIKHGIATLERGGVIRISATVDKDQLVLTVADNGPGIPESIADDSQPNFSGVGLNNIRERLQEMYGESHHFSVRNVSPTGCMATVIIPYQIKRPTHVANDNS
ncbi:MAG: histidine kinase [Gammaproteobacteria bacterium]|nr:histidine kinase [Gammaproteobacteria bacterium]